MDQQQLCEMITQAVLQRLRTDELPLDIPVEVSARHVHLTEAAVEALFGAGAQLTPKRPLSQPGQFLSEERVRIVTPKGEISGVAVLGPTRPAIQVELSATDARTLGIQAPVRLSGDLRDAADVYLIGPNGMIAAPGSAIIARPHIHILPADAERIHVQDGQTVSVSLKGDRPLTLDGVIVRVSAKAGLALHIDRDEANACLLAQPSTTRIRCSAQQAPACGPAAANASASDMGETPPVCTSDAHLITESKARALTAHSLQIHIRADALITPAAQDILRHAGATIIRV